MPLIDSKILILIVFVAIITLVGFGFPKEALAGYYTSGYFISTNLLEGVSPEPTTIDSFVYNLSAKPANTTSTIGFNQDGGSTWYKADGTTVGTESLVTGVDQTITLTGGWSGANFYYKVIFNSDGTDTPVLDDITLNYTVALPPVVSTSNATSVGSNYAILNGNITSIGGAAPTTRGFEYGISTSSVSTVSENGSFGTGIFSLVPTDLQAGQSYYFRAFATNIGGTGYGDWSIFSTSQGCNPPLSGEFNVSSSCTFPGFINGVEQGNLIIAEGVTLTINCGKDVGQTIVWNPGSSVIINGSIAICKGEGVAGGQLRKAYIWLTDADDDNYPPSTAEPVAQISAPTDARKRADLASTSNWTYPADIQYDFNDNDALVYPGRACGTEGQGYGSCSNNEDDGTCGYRSTDTQPDGGECNECTGSSYMSVPQSDNEDRWEQCAGPSYNACSNQYTRIGPDGFCDGGSAACDSNDNTAAVDAGYVCYQGTNANPSGNTNCGTGAQNCYCSNNWYQCDAINDCNYDQYYVGFNSGASCTQTNKFLKAANQANLTGYRCKIATTTAYGASSTVWDTNDCNTTDYCSTEPCKWYTGKQCSGGTCSQDHLGGNCGSSQHCSGGVCVAGDCNEDFCSEYCLPPYETTCYRYWWYSCNSGTCTLSHANFPCPY